MAKQRLKLADALKVGDHKIDGTMLMQALSGIITFIITEDWPVKEVREEIKDELFNVKVTIDAMLGDVGSETAVEEWSKTEGG